MIPINDLHPNELFRFVNVRGPLKEADAALNAQFVHPVYERLADIKIREAVKAQNPLYPDLKALDGKPDQLNRSLRRVDDYKTTSSFIPSPADYPKRYPALATLIDWLDANADHASLDALTDSFRAALDMPCERFVATEAFAVAQVVIWDNLLANFFRASDPSLVSLACKYLGTLHLLEMLVRNQQLPSTPGILYRSRPLLPKWLFNVSRELHLTPDEGVDDQRPTQDTAIDLLQARFNVMVQVLAELAGLAEKKKALAAVAQDKHSQMFVAAERLGGKRAKRKPKADRRTKGALENMASPLRASEEELLALSAQSIELATDLVGKAQTYDLGQVIGLLNRRAADLAARIGEKGVQRAIKVGNAIIESDDFCAEMLEKDPCARGTRRDFVSRGSYVTATLIGDLLVTQQQLVKYDLGEVAHVETAMAGLEKERTHRRLNRSEEFALTERETLTEDERETQTTDRFDMEKASSKTLRQDFNVDSGVSVSGNYGTVHFNSTLDASYGYSSQQAQSDATAFSREVTTRALERVKERVRQLKTVTVINEVEEISRHKLSNNTGDNIDGVYRWLDKFYLNKIINYGKRLMFEFSIPEPAQFFIFRQMLKPKANSAMVKPEHPATVLDPTGHTLKSPADLTEINYTFWAARYGATSIDPPPPQYLRVSHSWKNEYGTSQAGDVIDAFSKDVEVPKDYEAVLAQVLCDNFTWSAFQSWYLRGALATTGFGSGYTIINLPGISATVGISLLSKGMSWKINLVLTSQRSAKLFAQWQVGTYGKILDGYRAQKQDYESWVESQSASFGEGLTFGANNPQINREAEREELKKRCLELFTGQRFESFDAAVNGIYNVSGYPEILFAESIREGNLVKFFEQAFDWPNMTYIFYPEFWGRKNNWLSVKLMEDPSDPLFTKFLQSGFARAVVPARPGFEHFLMMFHLLSSLISSLGCSWRFEPAIFGALGISNTFSPGVNDPLYISVAQELQSALGYSEDTGPIYGIPYVQKVPTNLVYIAQNSHAAGTPWPGLPDNSSDPDIAPYL